MSEEGKTKLVMLETSLSISTLTGDELSRKRLLTDEQRRIYTHVKYKWKHISTHKSLAWSSGIRRHASFPKDLSDSMVSATGLIIPLLSKYLLIPEWKTS